MRRPWLKRMRLNFAKPLPQKLRDNAWASYRRQERFARRYGLTLTRAILWLVLGIVLFQLIGALVLTMQAKGAFSLPE